MSDTIITSKNMDETDEKKVILNRYRALLRSTTRTLSEADKKQIRNAFDLAMDAHKDVRRKSGEPYILHPIEVAIIVSKEIGLGKTSIVAALMHDVVEDSDYTLEDIQRMFGSEIARIIDGLTKISGIFDKDISVQAENFRKMLLTISDDVRVILIKLADRLHNMRTMESMKDFKQRKIASETLFLYAPLAHRFGLHNIKTELEDLSLKYTETEVYHDIEERLIKDRNDRTRYLKTFSSRIRDRLNKEQINFTIKERTKSIYSIRKKMKEQGISFNEVYDKFAIRVIVDSPPETEKADCWKVYSIITNIYQPNPKRLRDWITSPKSNGYESLHVTVMGPDGHWVEVQIRSLRMDEVAEKGYAAHWKYKDEDGYSDQFLDEWLTKVRDLLEMKASSAEEFVDSFKLNLFSDEIFVFTPDGELKRLPTGAFPLDFAYDIHTDIGSKTLGAKVNGKLVALNYKLRSGDQVEILTSEAQTPKDEWLPYTVTAKARNNIKQTLRGQRKKRIEEGRGKLLRKLNFVKIKPTEKIINQMARHFGLKNDEQLFEKVGKGLIDNTHIKGFLQQQNQGFMGYLRARFTRGNKNTPTSTSDGIDNNLKVLFGPNSENRDYKLAQCCTPIPGDSIFGYRLSSGIITVHRTDCPNALALQSKHANRIEQAEWLMEKMVDNAVILVLKGIDTVGLVNKVTQIISNDLDVNIKSINISGGAGVFEGIITVVVEDKRHLEKVIEQLRQVEGVTSVERRFKTITSNG